MVRFASRCSGFGHGRLGKAALVSGPGVAHKFSEARVACDRADLVGGAPGLGQSPGCRLAQPMGGTVRQARLIALVSKPATKRGPLERLCPAWWSRTLGGLAARPR